MHENDIAREIVDAAYKVHTALGPGLLESVYEAALARELQGRSDCIPCQAAWAGNWFQGCCFLTMALRIRTSLRAQATWASFLGLPAASRRW